MGTHSNIFRERERARPRPSASAVSVASSKRSVFTIRALSEGIQEKAEQREVSLSDIDTETETERECASGNVRCFYHDEENETPSMHSQSMISSMPPLLIVGLHADVDESARCVSIEEGLELGRKWDVPYIETSAVDGLNVNEVFVECVRTRWVYDTFPNVRDR